MSEIAKEAISARNLLESIGIKLQYPIEIHCDNVGAIYLANNHTTSQRTKHIDTRQHFVREYIEDDIIKVVFIKSEENQADIFTKNPTEETFQKHSHQIVNDKDVDKINYAFVSQDQHKFKCSDDPYIQYLHEWEAKQKINLPYPKKHRYGMSNEELISKVRKWETGEVPFTTEDLEEAFNDKAFSDMLKEGRIDVSDAYEDSSWLGEMD
jgi:hypothetical protein